MSSELEDVELNDVSAEKIPEGRFPGIVCFYRSAEQRDQKYGTQEGKNYIPEFGFDTYIPKLYGVSNAVRDSYKKSSHIITGCSVMSAKSTEPTIFYPHKNELVHGTATDAAYKSANQGKKYFVPWLYPSVENIKLYIRIFYPKDIIGNNDVFLKYKNDKKEATEQIKFKLVKVDDDWNPVELTEVTPTSQVRKDLPHRYEKMDFDRVMTDNEKKEKESIDITKEHIRHEGERIDKEEHIISYTEAKLNTESAELNQLKMNFDSLPLKGQLDYNVRMANLNKGRGDIKARREKLQQDKAALENKKNNLPEDEEIIMNKYKIYPADVSLTIASTSYDFQFGTNSIDTEISINRNGNNNNAALIAYYVRKDETGVEKEYIIGQVNILPKEYYKTVENYSDYSKSFNMPLYLNPMPIHFIQVDLRKQIEKRKNGEIVREDKLSSVSANIIPTNVINEVNNYFKQIGIRFRNSRSNSRLEIVYLKKIDNSYCLEVDGFQFKIEQHSGNDYVIPSNGKRTLDTWLLECFKRKLKTEIFLKEVEIGESTKIDGTQIDSAYLNLLEKYSKLCEKTINLFPTDRLRKITEYIVDYLANSSIFIFVNSDIDGCDWNGNTFTVAYANKNGFSSVVFNSAKNSFAPTIAHELGHALNLDHSFHQNYPMFPDAVSFETKTDWTKEVNTINESDHSGYGATYDNIMDYKGKNSDYIRNSFTKKQWEMITNIIVKRCSDIDGNTVMFTGDTEYRRPVDRGYYLEQGLVDELNQLL